MSDTMSEMDERSRQQQFEEQFLQQLRARAQALIRRGGAPADALEIAPLPDGADSVRATLSRLQRYDRDLLESLPGKHTLQLRFRRRIFGPLARTVVRLRAQVLTPTEALVEGRAPGPIGREAVLDALARYELLPQRERPTAVVYASPTGFTSEAQALAETSGPPTLILMGGRADGGWDVALPAPVRNGPWNWLFELESQDERLKRLLYHLEHDLTRLQTRGVSVTELAAQVGLPADETAALVRRACRNDPRLMTVVHDGTIHVTRSPLAEESTPMSLRTWIRKLLRMKPSAAERVREMTAQRVRLEQERHELDQRLDALEKDEREAVERGADARTDVERKQLAGRLMRTRRELRRVRAQAGVLTQQIDILGTHIHHVTLEEQGKRVALPDAEELAAEAAQAEQIMTQLAANADLAASVEVGAQSPMMADEEAAILEEFKQAAQQQAPESTAPAAERDASAAAPPKPPARASDRERAGGEDARPELS
jgi:hypothetical protein